MCLINLLVGVLYLFQGWDLVLHGGIALRAWPTSPDLIFLASFFDFWVDVAVTLFRMISCIAATAMAF